MLPQPTGKQKAPQREMSQSQGSSHQVFKHHSPRGKGTARHRWLPHLTAQAVSEGLQVEGLLLHILPLNRSEEGLGPSGQTER